MATHPFQTDDVRLNPIKDKVLAGQRLAETDALTLYATGDILAVGWLANWVRERMHGDTAYFNVNRHINPTNVCVAACRLCAFGRKKDAHGAYTMALEEAFTTAASGYSEAITEFHIVGGLHPDLPFQYFLDLVSGLKERFPQVHLKAFTMVEVAYLAKRAKLTIHETLEQMKEQASTRCRAGARRFSPTACAHYLRSQNRRRRWLDTARLAHQIGLKSNATMLYGHIENDEDRVDHLIKLERCRMRPADSRHLFRWHSTRQHAAATSSDHYRHAGHQTDCGQPSGARQFPARQGLLANDDAQDRADFFAFRRG